MKKITNVEVELIRLDEQDILTTSIQMYSTAADDSPVYVGGRFYDDEEEW